MNFNSSNYKSHATILIIGKHIVGRGGKYKQHILVVSTEIRCLSGQSEFDVLKTNHFWSLPHWSCWNTCNRQYFLMLQVCSNIYTMKLDMGTKWIPNTVPYITLLDSPCKKSEPGAISNRVRAFSSSSTSWVAFTVNVQGVINI